MDCSDLEELNATYRIATLRYRRFVDSLKGMVTSTKDIEESKLLEDEMSETYRALSRHQNDHGCRG